MGFSFDDISIDTSGDSLELLSAYQLIIDDIMNKYRKFDKTESYYETCRSPSAQITSVKDTWTFMLEHFTDYRLLVLMNTPSAYERLMYSPVKYVLSLNSHCFYSTDVGYTFIRIQPNLDYIQAYARLIIFAVEKLYLNPILVFVGHCKFKPIKENYYNMPEMIPNNLSRIHILKFLQALQDEFENLGYGCLTRDIKCRIRLRGEIYYNSEHPMIEEPWKYAQPLNGVIGLLKSLTGANKPSI